MSPSFAIRCDSGIFSLLRAPSLLAEGEGGDDDEDDEDEECTECEEATSLSNKFFLPSKPSVCKLLLLPAIHPVWSGQVCVRLILHSPDAWSSLVPDVNSFEDWLIFFFSFAAMTILELPMISFVEKLFLRGLLGIVKDILTFQQDSKISQIEMKMMMMLFDEEKNGIPTWNKEKWSGCVEGASRGSGDTLPRPF